MAKLRAFCLPESIEDEWTVSGLDGVVSGRYSMSQRKLSSVEWKRGGIDRVTKLARERGVHLMVVADDQGVELVAANLHPFKIVC